MAKRLKIGDCVKIRKGKGIRYGWVTGLGDDGTVEYLDVKSSSNASAPAMLAERLDPIIITGEELSALCRFDTDIDGLMDGYPVPENHIVEGYCRISLEDVREALLKAKLSGTGAEELGRRWWFPLWDLFEDEAGLSDPELPDDGPQLPGLPSSVDVYWETVQFLDSFLSDSFDPEEFCEPGLKPFDVDEAVKEMDLCLRNAGKAPEKREYTDRQMEYFIREWDGKDGLDEADEVIKDLFRRFTDTLAEKDDEIALMAKAYACYGGNAIYGCDWAESRKCLEKLFAMTCDPYAANTLGYIYYYGRETGEPDYGKAFYYFSVGSAGGVDESQYKVGDMFRRGLGVPANREIAMQLYGRSFAVEMSRFLQGEAACKLADASLRLGGMLEDSDSESGLLQSLDYYLIAKTAMRRRMSFMDYYGDSSVSGSIDEGLSGVEEKLSGLVPVKRCAIYNFGYLFRFCREEGRLIQGKIKHTSGGRCSITFSMVKHFRERFRPRMFVSLPELGFCGFLDKITVTGEDFGIPAEGESFTFDNAKGLSFFLNGTETEELFGEWTVSVSGALRAKEYRMAVLRMPEPNGGNQICRVPEGSYSVGDTVVMRTRYGLRSGEITRFFTAPDTDLMFPPALYDPEPEDNTLNVNGFDDISF